MLGGVKSELGNDIKVGGFEIPELKVGWRG